MSQVKVWLVINTKRQMAEKESVTAMKWVSAKSHWRCNQMKQQNQQIKSFHPTTQSTNQTQKAEETDWATSTLTCLFCQSTWPTLGDVPVFKNVINWLINWWWIKEFAFQFAFQPASLMSLIKTIQQSQMLTNLPSIWWASCFNAALSCHCPSCDSGSLSFFKFKQCSIEQRPVTC